MQENALIESIVLDDAELDLVQEACSSPEVS